MCITNKNNLFSENHIIALVQLQRSAVRAVAEILRTQCSAVWLMKNACKQWTQNFVSPKSLLAELFFLHL